MRRISLFLGSCAMFGACVAPGHDRPTAPAVPRFTNQFLAGGWVLAGASCDGDGGVVYGKDGRWITLGAAGTWQVTKGRLVETMLEQEDADGEMRRLIPPVRYDADVEVTGPDAFVARRGDGSVRRLRRCGPAVR